MQKPCAQCQTSYEFNEFDHALLQKISASAIELHDIPPPSVCPDCRQQRRLARRNERKFYHAQCNLCRKDILTMYGADEPFPVYCYECWWSDQWDPLEFGREYDFSQNFFEQFQELQNAVPRIALFGKNNENCAYINHSVNSKNCYLCVDVSARDTYYSKWMIQCYDCCDCYQLENSERCYESQYAVGTNRCVYCFLCHQSSDIAFCYDCVECRDCLLCTHLRHKRFCLRNEQLTEKEFKSRMQEWGLGSHAVFQKALSEYFDLWKQTFHKSQILLNAEHCAGDFIENCKNVHHSFGVIESQDCAYCYDAGHMRDCMDAYESAFDCELQYDSHACCNAKRVFSCSVCHHVDSLACCDTCHNSSHLFGCISIKRKQYCILNKQYTQEQYEDLIPKIIAHMQGTGEWEGYFPASISPFCYNESTAMEYYPLTEEEARSKGYRWRHMSDSTDGVEKVIPAERLPDHINDIPDDIQNWAIKCKETGRPFRIVKPELKFYRTMNVPVPRLHPDERHKRRMAFTNPRRLCARDCARCGKSMQTTYGPERTGTVYCEDCYLKEVY
jgi:hypothetical protein